MYSAKEAAEMTGLSTATLRYYEKEQLLPQIARTSQKYRQYSDIEWIKMVQCLRRANVPIQSAKKYIALLVQGGKTMEQRYGMVQDYSLLEIERSNLFGAFTESFDIMREELRASKKRETELKRKEKELVAELSHDLKTPITGINTICDVLSLKVQDKYVLGKVEGIMYLSVPGLELQER